MAKMVIKKMRRRMFKRPIDEYELRCSNCPRVFTPAEIAAANAHQNFKKHTIVVYHTLEGGIGPLKNF